MDIEAIGQGIYDMMIEDDKAVVAFGMIPLEFMNMATEAYKDRVSKLFCDKYYSETSKENIEHVKKTIKPEVIGSFQKDLTVSIFEAATRAGKMIT